jgi:hypothetical protein
MRPDPRDHKPIIIIRIACALIPAITNQLTVAQDYVPWDFEARAHAMRPYVVSKKSPNNVVSKKSPDNLPGESQKLFQT